MLTRHCQALVKRGTEEQTQTKNVTKQSSCTPSRAHMHTLFPPTLHTVCSFAGLDSTHLGHLPCKHSNKPKHLSTCCIPVPAPAAAPAARTDKARHFCGRTRSHDETAPATRNRHQQHQKASNTANSARTMACSVALQAKQQAISNPHTNSWRRA